MYLRRLLVSRYATGVIALVGLLVVSPFIVDGSLSKSALLALLPFAAILAVASCGQTLVVQQGGIDLSVAGAMSVSAATFTVVAHRSQDLETVRGVAAALLVCVVAGALSGLAISLFDVTPLVATLAMNGLLTGLVLSITGGFATPSPPSATSWALDSTLAVPHLVWVAVLIIVVLHVATTATPFGRRFVALGRSPLAAATAGVATWRYRIVVYALASACYGAAGIMLAAYLNTPPNFAGANYLLLTVAAVVVGGTSLAGGAGSVVATTVGALFLTQLQQVVTGLGAPTSVQLITQGLVIAFAVLLRQLLAQVRRVLNRGTRAASEEYFDSDSHVPTPA